MATLFLRCLATAGALVFVLPDAASTAASAGQTTKTRPSDLAAATVSEPKAQSGSELSTTPIAERLAGADRPIAEALRDLLATRIGEHIVRPDERSAVQTFYRKRGFAPIWTEGGALGARAREAMTFLQGVSSDGLDSSDYPGAAFDSDDPQILAQDELKLTNSVLTFARHARTGRVHFSRVSEAAAFDLRRPNPEDVLSQIASSSDVHATLDAHHPLHPEYRALKAKLAEMRGSTRRTLRIESGPTLRYESGKKAREAIVQDPRVPVLRQRLAISPAASMRYDKALAEAVQAFQKSHGLKADGQLTAATVAALNEGGDNKRIDTIIANMERWRWLPRDLGVAYVVVNIPDYSLSVVSNGKLAWNTRVIVGKPGEMATPLLSETMKFITINPTWNVPPSIVRNEYLPRLQRNPAALERIGLRVTRKKDGTLHIYQPPGPRNALGQIRFNFPNPFMVYQHDTPAKHLFAKSERALSHGCVRVQHPEKYAEVLLSITQAKDGFTAEQLKALYGDKERTIQLKSPVMVHLTYQTAFVDDAGRLQLRKDLYGRDARLLRLLRNERAVADLPVEPGSKPNNNPVLARNVGR
jgi:murein L,D-transpeptidase YcbB/YkuD